MENSMIPKLLFVLILFGGFSGQVFAADAESGFFREPEQETPQSQKKTEPELEKEHARKIAQAKLDVHQASDGLTQFKNILSGKVGLKEHFTGKPTEKSIKLEAVKQAKSEQDNLITAAIKHRENLEKAPQGSKLSDSDIQKSVVKALKPEVQEKQERDDFAKKLGLTRDQYSLFETKVAEGIKRDDENVRDLWEKEIQKARDAGENYRIEILQKRLNRILKTIEKGVSAKDVRNSVERYKFESDREEDLPFVRTINQFIEEAKSAKPHGKKASR